MGMLLALTRDRPRAELAPAFDYDAPGARPDGGVPPRPRPARRRRHRRPPVSGRGAGAALKARGVASPRDRRARARYGGAFPAEEVHVIPSATRGPRSVVARARRRCWAAGSARRPARGRLGPAVVGFGGYPTVPPLLAAALRGVPTVIHEQNAVMGRANRLLAPRVTRHRHRLPRVLGAEPALGQGGAHRQSGAAGGDRGGARRPIRRSARRAASAARLRRQPGRARDGRRRAAGDRAALPRARRCGSDRAAGARGGPGARAPRPMRLGGRGRGAPFFTDLPARMAAPRISSSSRSGASTVAELR
jgi:UDP-N-acetylglucosamine--N-acetylmuramyl-(pentapeptide) pyrophosphoryl-undecaprenol N-acetylglucosamine transferase